MAQKEPENQKNFEDVKQQVYQELSRQKQTEVQQILLEELTQKYNVAIHDSKFAEKKEDSEKTK